jgi:hypothetical protein
LLPRKQRHRVADQADQWKCPHAAKGISLTGLSGGTMLFALESDQKAKKKRQNNLEAFGRKHL